MQHAEINDRQYPELYVLNRLSDAERDEFEQHLGGCVECQEAVRAAGHMSRGLREVRADFAEPRVPFWQRRVPVWRGAIWAAACVIPILVAAVAWERVAARTQAVLLANAAADRQQIAALQAQSGGTVPIYPLELLRGDGSGEQEPRVEVPANVPSIVLALPRDLAIQASGAELRDASGKAVWKLDRIAVGAAESAGLSVPVAVLRQGRYVLVLANGDRVVGRFGFVVTGR